MDQATPLLVLIAATFAVASLRLLPGVRGAGFSRNARRLQQRDFRPRRRLAGFGRHGDEAALDLERRWRSSQPSEDAAQHEASRNRPPR